MRQEKLSRGFVSIPSHRISAHLDAMRIVNQAVKDTSRQSGIAELLVPAAPRCGALRNVAGN